jgi:hypothetical protein
VRQETVKIEMCDTRHRFLSPFVRVCFLDSEKLYWLIPASCAVWLASVLLMLSAGVIHSNAATWDLLFNLEGAWRLYTGQVLHVDFHDVLGDLPFAITALGFQIIGLKPIAFVVGECVLAAVFTAFAIVTVKDRLPTVPAFLFIFMNVLLILVPTVIGDWPVEFTFAMAYNRFGWSATSILFLILFIEPRGTRDPVWTDLVAGSVLTIGLFYLKITYFGVAVVAISLALLTSPHIRRHWLGWWGVLLLAILVAIGPMNDGYRADILFQIASGRIRSSPLPQASLFTKNGIEQIWVVGEIIVLLYLSSQRAAARTDVLIGFYIWVTGFFLLSQNSQTESMPTYAVLALLLYVRLGDWLKSATYPPLTLVSCLMTCALLPLLPLLFSNSFTLIMYNIKARHTAHAFVITTTNLQGLAVPTDSDDILDEVAAAGDRQDYFSRIRASRSGVELSQHEYIKTILALADFLRDKGAASARIVVIDQTNPLPFVLGAPAPRGDNLWSGGGIAWRPPEKALQEAEYVAIPRFPTERATLIEGLKAYHEYLLTRFVRRWETPYWTVLERLNAQ